MSYKGKEERGLKHLGHSDKILNISNSQLQESAHTEFA